MEKILFVDDEKNVLDGLKRMLRSMRNEWDMRFVISAKDALALLEKESFDVVVSDMRMPEMDGAELLTIVKDKYPHIIRIILSGYSEKELIMKSVRPTHQFLTKPCDANTLKKIIIKAFKLHTILESEKVKNVISQIDTLPSLPLFYSKIMKLLADPDTSIRDVAKLVKQDMGMTAQILKLVNSSYFGFYKEIKDSVEATVMLGLNTIKTLALSYEIFSSIETNPNVDFSFTKLWDHSMYTSVFAKVIAEDISNDDDFTGNAFTAGFLHDIGILILASKLPESYNKILHIHKMTGKTLWESEYEILSTSHAEIGAYLLGLWGFNDNIVDGIIAHHTPGSIDEDIYSLSTVIHVADVLALTLTDDKESMDVSKFDMEFITKNKLQDKISHWTELCKSKLEQEA